MPSMDESLINREHFPNDVVARKGRGGELWNQEMLVRRPRRIGSYLELQSGRTSSPGPGPRRIRRSIAICEYLEAVEPMEA
jgi:hypothetical protein